MRVLFLTQVLPYPLDAGPKVRGYYVLRHLSKRGHEVVLASFVRGKEEPQHLHHLRQYCRSIHTVHMNRAAWRDGWSLVVSLMRNEPFLIVRDQVTEMVDQVKRLVASEGPFDTVHADQLWMAPYALLAQSATARHDRILMVLDQHNAVFQIPRRLAGGHLHPLMRMLLSLEAHKLARYEHRICSRFDRVVWVTEEDREALAEVAPQSADARIHSQVIPICVDPAEQPILSRERNPRRVTFLGGMHWPPNAAGISWFAQSCWPEISRRAPEAILTVIGKQPPKNLVKGSATQIEVKGYVSNLSHLLRETAVFIIPLHAGGGMRVKILEAWKWGLPVVSTRIGAEGLAAADGGNLLLAHSPKVFSAAVVRILRNPALARKLIRGGRETVRTYYDWRKVYPQWDSIYQPPDSQPAQVESQAVATGS